MKLFLEQTSFWCAAIASLLIATHTFGGWAFIIYLISNIATIMLLRQSNASKAVTYQSYLFIFVNIIGIYYWML